MADVELPRIVGGRYRPIRLLGRGGMGVVYEVEHVHTGQRLALKVLASMLATSPSIVERFQREARAPAHIRSEHVVTVTDADVAPELGHAPYVVMELLEGEDLSARGLVPEPPERVVAWLRQIARVLDKAHRLGIVHRDLKPANLFLTRREDGSELVKILDFGIAKMMDVSGATTAGEVLGTPAYMAPEQARGDLSVTGAADRFALGLIAYRLLCGAVYWRAKGLVELVHEIVYAPLVAPSARESKLGPAFDAWFAKATARDPQARFESAAEQVEALARSMGLSTLPVGDPVTPVIAPRESSPPPSSGAIHRAATLTDEPPAQPSPAAQSVALAPTEHTSPGHASSTAPSSGRGRSSTVVALVGAFGLVVVAAALVLPRQAPTGLVAGATPSAPASVALPPLSPTPPPASSAAPPLAPSAALPVIPPTAAVVVDAGDHTPAKTPRTAPAPARRGAQPAASTDPFADQK
jgi:eukaryotic-like serine/threonine-protein kinase